MKKGQYSFFEWPDISFKEIENIEIENKTGKILYKSLIKILFFPESIFKPFYNLFIHDPEKINKSNLVN
ncbi:MAG: hypothetical protein Q8P10_00945 [bacterium]|nr:hypothetical protein [bacterium]